MPSDKKPNQKKPAASKKTTKSQDTTTQEKGQEKDQTKKAPASGATAGKKKTTAGKKKTTAAALNLPQDAKDLSEEQLISMPEDMYMNPLQLQFFKLRLEDMRCGILVEIQAAKDRLKTPPEAGDEVDMAAHVEAQQIDIRIVERKTKLLVNIEGAIRRISENDYGYCTETGEPIGIERLLVRPTATLCITSKEVHEAKERTEEL